MLQIKTHGCPLWFTYLSLELSTAGIISIFCLIVHTQIEYQCSWKGLLSYLWHIFNKEFHWGLKIDSGKQRQDIIEMMRFKLYSIYSDLFFRLIVFRGPQGANHLSKEIFPSSKVFEESQQNKMLKLTK